MTGNFTVTQSGGKEYLNGFVNFRGTERIDRVSKYYLNLILRNYGLGIPRNIALGKF